MQQVASIKHNPQWNLKTWEPALVTSANYNFTSTTDGPTVIKYLSGLTINAGHTVTTSNRNKGLVLFVNGDCIINGTLSMTARGCISPGDNLAIDYTDANFLVNPTNLNNFTYKIPAVGGSGAAATGTLTSTVNRHGTNGTVGTDGGTGGGAGGGLFLWSNLGARASVGSGAAGTSYSGGSAGGAVANTANATINGYSATGNGGAGGGGRAYTDTSSVPKSASGGAGNPGGVGMLAYGGVANAGESGTGGLLVLVVRGNLTIGSTGKIVSNGSNGGNVSCSNGSTSSGGGSGGGSVTVLYTSTYNNLGTIQANGGNGGSAYSYGTRYTSLEGGSGGAGSIRVNQISI